MMHQLDLLSQRNEVAGLFDRGPSKCATILTSSTAQGAHQRDHKAGHILDWVHRSRLYHGIAQQSVNHFRNLYYLYQSKIIKSLGCGSFESTRYVLAIQPLFSLLFMEIPVIL